MATNLKDKGYPQAKTQRVNKSDKKNTPMKDTTDRQSGKAVQRTVARPKSPNPEKENLTNKLITAYNNRAFGTPGAPLLQRVSSDYQDNDDNRAYDSAIVARDHSGNRLGFVDKDASQVRTNYTVGIDNLPLGQNYVSKTINTPLGELYGEYDGDGTAALSYKTSPNVYYLRALANMLTNRGTL